MTKNDYDNQMLVDLRQSRKLTQEFVANCVGVSRFTVIRVEKGESASWDLLKTLCQFYNISISELLKTQQASV